MIPFTGTLRLLLGTFYPAYASYKAIRTKNVREYVKWMMYWIVFALFTSIETFTDIFVAFWFPFYYELKILFLIWLISPVSKGSLGSSILYRSFVHSTLINREGEIDQMILKLQEQVYNTAIKLVVKVFNYVSNILMQTALRAPALMNELVETQKVEQWNETDAPAATNAPRFEEVVEIDQADLEEKTERQLTPPSNLAKKARQTKKKSTRGKYDNQKNNKKVIKTEILSSNDSDNGQDLDGGVSQSDMDPDYDPKVMTAMEPSPEPSSERSTGPRTRNKSRSESMKTFKKKN